jgi:hypothetical protein
VNPFGSDSSRQMKRRCSAWSAFVRGAFIVPTTETWVMNIAALRIFAIASLLFSLSVNAECAFPKPPASVPDGKTASEADMVAAMSAFKAYDAEVVAFGACLEQETKEKAAGSGQLMQLKTMQMKKHNAAVAELQEKAKQFNEQVRIFKSR